MLTLLAPLFLLQTPLPQIEIRVERTIGLDTPAVCCSQSKGQAKIDDTPKRVRSLKQAWLDHQNSGKSLGIQATKAAYAKGLKIKKGACQNTILPLDASFGWTSQPPKHAGKGHFIRAKAIIIDDNGQQQVIEFDGDLPDLQKFLPAGIQSLDLQGLLENGGNSPVQLGCSQSAKSVNKSQDCAFSNKGCGNSQECSQASKGCGNSQECSQASKGCGNSQECSFQSGKFGKKDASRRIQTSNTFVFDGSTEGLPEGLFELIRNGGNQDWHPGHQEQDEIGEDIEVCFKTNKALEEAYDRIDELEERLAHMERLLEHISDELIREEH